MNSLDHRAREFARLAHAEQTYGPGAFFELHLTRVVGVLERFGETDPVLLAAGWLHDVVEDTPTTVDEVRSAFGEDVADLVDRLTDVRGGTRRERQTATHACIRERVGAVRVKLADRIANIEFNLAAGDPIVDRMYRKEYPRFREQLFRPDEFADMWEHLDRLLFPAGPIP